MLALAILDIEEILLVYVRSFLELFEILTRLIRSPKEIHGAFDVFSLRSRKPWPTRQTSPAPSVTIKSFGFADVSR